MQMATATPNTQQQQQQPYNYQPPATLEEVRTLWIGDLQYWADESYLSSCFSHTGQVVSIKIIRNKLTGLPEGYGFIEFVSHAAAESVLQTYNGTPMPGTEQPFRLNWASFGGGERRADGAPDHSIFVGDLAPDVTDYLLQETFRVHYPSVRGAKVVVDPNTGRSKGYGFVKFGDENERNRAMTEMNGVYCSSRPMRISAATPKKPAGYQQPYSIAAKADPWSAYYGYGQGYDASYAYGAIQDPSLYAYNSYAGYPQYPQQAESVQDLSVAVPVVEPREEVYDPLSAPDVDKLNEAYLAVHSRAILGRPLWTTTSSFPLQSQDHN